MHLYGCPKFEGCSAPICPLDEECHIAATGDINQRLVATPPDQEIVGQGLIARRRVKITPAITIVHFEPGHHICFALATFKFEATHEPRWNTCSGKDHRHCFHEACVGVCVGSQKFNIRVWRRIVHQTQ